MSDVNDHSNPADGNFAEYIARERQRLHAEREQIFTSSRKSFSASSTRSIVSLLPSEALRGGKDGQGSASASAGWPAIASAPRQQAGGTARADPAERWAVPRRNSGKDGSEGRQERRDVSVECPELSDQEQSGAPRRREVSHRRVRLGGGPPVACLRWTPPQAQAWTEMRGRPLRVRRGSPEAMLSSRKRRDPIGKHS